MYQIFAVLYQPEKATIFFQFQVHRLWVCQQNICGILMKKTTIIQELPYSEAAYTEIYNRYWDKLLYYATVKLNLSYLFWYIIFICKHFSNLNKRSHNCYIHAYRLLTFKYST